MEFANDGNITLEYEADQVPFEIGRSGMWTYDENGNAWEYDNNGNMWEVQKSLSSPMINTVEFIPEPIPNVQVIDPQHSNWGFNIVTVVVIIFAIYWGTSALVGTHNCVKGSPSGREACAEAVMPSLNDRQARFLLFCSVILPALPMGTKKLLPSMPLHPDFIDIAVWSGGAICILSMIITILLPNSMDKTPNMLLYALLFVIILMRYRLDRSSSS